MAWLAEDISFTPSIPFHWIVSSVANTTVLAITILENVMSSWRASFRTFLDAVVKSHSHTLRVGDLPNLPAPFILEDTPFF